MINFFPPNDGNDSDQSELYKRAKALNHQFNTETLNVIHHCRPVIESCTSGAFLLLIKYHPSLNGSFERCITFGNDLSVEASLRRYLKEQEYLHQVALSQKYGKPPHGFQSNS